MTRSIIVAVTAAGLALAPAMALAQTTAPASSHMDKMDKGKMEKSGKTKHMQTTGSASHNSGKATTAPNGTMGSPSATDGAAVAK